MRISDWSSDVCSSDLAREGVEPARQRQREHRRDADPRIGVARVGIGLHQRRRGGHPYLGLPALRDIARIGPDRPALEAELDRKSVVEGKSVSVRVDLGGSRIIQKKTQTETQQANISQ